MPSSRPAYGRFIALAALSLAAFPAPAASQSLDLTIGGYGLSIGDSRQVRGVRLNFRDHNMVLVEGVNATFWYPYDDARGGTVRGLALGLPVTGARNILGAGIGLFGVGAEGDFKGVGVSGLATGAGRDLAGIFVAGLGAGNGGDFTGLRLVGLGAGSGGDVRGITIAGLGTGAGGDVRGVSMAGLGLGGGGDITGLQVAGLGVGGGGHVRGITIGGLGVGGGSSLSGLQIGGIGVGGGGDVAGITLTLGGTGAGGDLTGITLAAIGVGAGGTLRGFAFGGIGVGAPRIRGIVVASAAGGHDVKGGVIAPFYFRIESEEFGDYGRVNGLTVSAFNHIKGEQFGLSVGLLNHAWVLHGVQIGLLNYAGNNPKGLRLLPIFNRAW